MKKYYIEIYPNDKNVETKMENGYIIQSKWYNTEKDAIKMAESIQYVDESCEVCLMSSEWDNNKNEPIDIKLERFLSKNKNKKEEE